MFTLNGGAVTWKSSKQDTMAASTCESEYIAASKASKENRYLWFVGPVMRSSQVKGSYLHVVICLVVCGILGELTKLWLTV